MFFRNLTLFRFSPAVATDLDRLDEALAEHRLRPCGPLEMFTRGFVPPVGRGEGEPLTHAVKQSTLFTVGGEDKLLPAAVINDELHRKVQKIAEEEGRKVGGREDIIAMHNDSRTPYLSVKAEGRKGKWPGTIVRVPGKPPEWKSPAEANGVRMWFPLEAGAINLIAAAGAYEWSLTDTEDTAKVNLGKRAADAWERVNICVTKNGK